MPIHVPILVILAVSQSSIAPVEKFLDSADIGRWGDECVIEGDLELLVILAFDRDRDWKWKDIKFDINDTP